MEFKPINSEGGDCKLVDKRTVDLVQFNPVTGKVTDVRMFDEYQSGAFIEVTPGEHERAWEMGFWGLKETSPDRVRRKNYDPNLKSIKGGAIVNPSKSARIPRRAGLRVVRGGLK